MRSKLIHSAHGQRTYAVVLRTGDEVRESLRRFAEQEGLAAAQVTAIGAFQRAVFRYFDWESKQYQPIRCDELYEAGSDAFGFTATTCLLFRVLQDAADGVDGDLDQAAMVAAIEGLGEIEVNAGPPGSLSADKHDAGDHLFLCDYRAEARECVQRPGEPIEVAG